ncbi:hypothetical protein BDF19DRAFT_219889 [Syncephalis fuscata]|nr:hypothetical protein BDF19DRAFT_219889 [Syncephalis fuscata]
MNSPAYLGNSKCETCWQINLQNSAQTNMRHLDELDLEPRERKTIDRYVDVRRKRPIKTERPAEPNGTGVAIGDMEKACIRLDRLRGSDDLLKLLHRALYGRPGTAHFVKQGIRAWNGLPTVSPNSEEYEPEAAKQLMEQLERWYLYPLYQTCLILGVPAKRNKPECLARLYNFLVKPWNTDSRKRQRKIEPEPVDEKKKRAPRRSTVSTDGNKKRHRVKPVEDEGSDSEDEAPKAKKRVVKRGRKPAADNAKKGLSSETVDDDDEHSGTEKVTERKKSGRKPGKRATSTTATKEEKKEKKEKTTDMRKKRGKKTASTTKAQEKNSTINEKTLRQAIHVIISTSDLETMTPRNVREKLSKQFKQDMDPVKSDIKRIVNEIVTEMVDN